MAEVSIDPKPVRKVLKKIMTLAENAVELVATVMDEGGRDEKYRLSCAAGLMEMIQDEARELRKDLKKGGKETGANPGS